MEIPLLFLSCRDRREQTAAQVKQTTPGLPRHGRIVAMPVMLRRWLKLQLDKSDKVVMPGLVPGTHALRRLCKTKAWMAGTSPAMTEIGRYLSATKQDAFASVLVFSAELTSS